MLIHLIFSLPALARCLDCAKPGDSFFLGTALESCADPALPELTQKARALGTVQYLDASGTQELCALLPQARSVSWY